MTPAEFEWHQERIEDAYARGQIGKITFLRRMSALGFNDLPKLRELLKELDEKRIV